MSSGAHFTINQAANVVPSGTTDLTRTDLYLAQTVHFVGDSSSGQTSPAWTVLAWPDGAMRLQFTNATTFDATFSPTVPGSYLVQFLVGDGLGANAKAFVFAVTRSSTGLVIDDGVREPAFGELVGHDNTAGNDRGYAKAYEAALARIVPSVATVAILRARVPSRQNRIRLLGHTAAGDGGDGDLYWDAASTETDDDGTVFQPTGLTTGRWKRVLGTEARSQWWGLDNTGATGVDVFFNTKIAPTLAAKGLRFIFGQGTFQIAGSGAHGYGIALQSGMYLSGATRDTTTLLRATGCSQVLAGFAVNNVTVRDLTIVNGTNDSFRGAILIAPNADLVPGGGRSSNIRVEDCNFLNTQANTASQGFTTLIVYFADHVWFTNNYAQRSQFRASACRGLVVANNRLDNPYALGMSIVSQTGFAALGDDELYDIVVSGNNITSPQQGGIYIGNDSTSAAGKMSRVRIVNNSIRGVGAVAGIYMRAGLSTEDVIISGNTVDGRTDAFPITAVTYGGSTITVTCPLHGRITGNQTYLTAVAGTVSTTLYTVTFVDVNTFTIAGTFTGPYVAGGSATFAPSGLGIYSFDVDDGSGSVKRLAIDNNKISNLQNIGIWVNTQHAEDISVRGNSVYKAVDTAIRIQDERFSVGASVGDLHGLVIAQNIIQLTAGRGILIQSGANTVPGGAVRDFIVHDNMIRNPTTADAGISVQTFQGTITGHIHHNWIYDDAGAFSEGGNLMTNGILENTHGNLGIISNYYDHNQIKGGTGAQVLLDAFSLSTVEIAYQQITQPERGVTIGTGAQTVNPGTEHASEYVVGRIGGNILAANSSLTLATGGTLPTGIRVAVTRLDNTAFTYAVINGPTTGTLFTFPASGPPARAWFKWDGTNFSYLFSEFVNTETIR